MGLKPLEILLILIVVVLLFGTTRLPQLGSSLGSAIRNFKKGFQGGEDAPEGEAQKNPGALASGNPAKDGSAPAQNPVPTTKNS